MSIITIFVAFVFALALLIAIHEYGHFIVARACGIKVLRFSLGFGKVLYSYQKDENSTEFVLAAIPLGGYVKMLDEREGDVKDEEKQYAFNLKPVWQRIAVVAAGPIFNFILAIILFWGMFIHGISGISPIVGAVSKGSMAEAANIQVEDTFVSINGKSVQTWANVQMGLLAGSLENDGIVNVTVEDINKNIVHKVLDFSDTPLLKEEGDMLKKMGMQIWIPKMAPVIAGIVDGEAAQAAGLIAGDRLISANNKVMDTWQDWVKIVRANPNKTMDLKVERNGAIIQVELTPKSKVTDGETMGYIGAYQEQSKVLFERFWTIESYGIAAALTHALDKTWSMSVVTVKLLGKLVSGDASLKNISGPITIAKFAGQSAETGFDHYLYFMAIISLSLGILNLLPIPVLDGGHLMFYFAEVIKGSPVSEKTQIIGQNIGLAILGTMMAIAFYNDIMRLLQ
jgi:regulator of sigma E protease